MLGTYHLTALYDVLKDLHFIYQTDKIYSYLLENLMKALDADAASIFVTARDKEHLTLRACIGAKKNNLEVIAGEMPFPFGKGVCGWVAKFNQPVIVDDTQKDPRFNPQVDVLTGYKTKSVLCTPLSDKDEIYGVIEILNKKSSAFNKNDLDLVALVAKQAAIALGNAKFYTELESARNFDMSLLANMTSGLVAVDTQAVITHFNPAAEKILLLSAPQTMGQLLPESLTAYPALSQGLMETLKTKEKKQRQEVACERADKAKIQIGYSTFLIQGLSRDLLGAGIIFQELSQFKG